MVQRNRGNRAGLRLHHIRRIEPSAQPDFQHRHLDSGLGKVEKRHRRRQLEECRSQVGRHACLKPLSKLRHLRFSDHGLVDSNPLAKINEMRRRVQPHTIAGCLQHGRRHGRRRAFAVGAADVQTPEPPLGITQPAQERPHGLKPQLDSMLLESVEILDGG